MSLSLDPEALNTCVSCGLCLPHCPTYRVTGDEALSPRGRIDAMRSIEVRGAPIDSDVVEFMSTCVQCRGCEPACPSGVPYGDLIEATRSELARQGRITPWWQRRGLAVLPRHGMLLAGSTMLAWAQRFGLVPRRFVAGRLPVRRGPAVRATATSEGAHVWLYTGCVMDAWMRSTHRSTATVLDAMGMTYALPGSTGGCCGALHAHAGLHDDAVALAERVMRSMPGDAPIVVNSAGCGAQLQHYGALLGTEDAIRFAERVVDIGEFVAAHADRLPELRPTGATIVVQDPCHLRHVQRAHEPVREMLRPIATLVELDDAGLCCGAGGAYSVVEPELATDIRDRKLAAIDRAVAASGATVVVSANPGCSMHLERSLSERGLTVRHPIDVPAQRWRE
ncbi:MAG: (Fe-S)-binding protein [Ilumatobacteraceae bacterium]